MFDELKKSISAILYERTTSPLYGSFILSWCVWNWKILYLTVFVSEDKIKGNKIDYILSNFWNNNYIFGYPIISTIILITVIPFASNGAYWLSMKFENWKIEKKKSIEKKQLLSFEQSLALREEIIEQQSKLDRMLGSKDLEIEQLRGVVKNKEEEIEIIKAQDKKTVKTKSSEIENMSPAFVEQQEIDELKNKITASPLLTEQLNSILQRMQGGYQLRDSTTSKLVGLLEGGDYIVNTGDGKYQFTAKGKKLQTAILNGILFNS